MVGNLLKGFKLLGGKIKQNTPQSVLNAFKKGNAVSTAGNPLLEKLKNENAIIYGNKKFSKARFKNWGKALIDETMHPIETFKKQVLDVKFGFDPKTGEMYNRSLAGKIGTGALTFGLPAYFGYSVLNDDSYDTKGKVINAVGGTAIALGSRKMLPGIIGYQLLGKIAPPKQPDPNSGGHYAEPANDNPTA